MSSQDIKETTDIELKDIQLKQMSPKDTLESDEKEKNTNAETKNQEVQSDISYPIDTMNQMFEKSEESETKVVDEDAPYYSNTSLNATPKDIQYDIKKSIIYGIGSCTSFGICNFLIAEVTAEVGVAALFMYFYPIACLWVLYNGGYALYSQVKYGTFWHKERSQYFKKEKISLEYKVNWISVRSIPARSLFTCLIYFTLFQSFEFAALAKVNSGVIASCFVTSIFFTVVIFRIAYKEQLVLLDYIGMTMVMSCVVVIALGKEDNVDETAEENEQEYQYLLLAVISAVLVGLWFAFNGLNLRQYLGRFDQDPLALSINSNSLFAFLMMPLYIIWVQQNGPMDDVIFWKSFGSAIFMFSGFCFLTSAFKYGKGGLVIAIDSTKIIIQILLEVIINKKIPSLLQNIGIVLGLGGLMVIILKNEKKSK